MQRKVLHGVVSAAQLASIIAVRRGKFDVGFLSVLGRQLVELWINILNEPAETLTLQSGAQLLPLTYIL